MNEIESNRKAEILSETALTNTFVGLLGSQLISDTDYAIRGGKISSITKELLEQYEKEGPNNMSHLLLGLAKGGVTGHEFTEVLGAIVEPNDLATALILMGHELKDAGCTYEELGDITADITNTAIVDRIYNTMMSVEKTNRAVSITHTLLVTGWNQE